MAFSATTTGTLSPVPIDDIGYEIIHPITIDLQSPVGTFLVDEIRDSDDLQNAIDSGYITVKDEYNNNITNIVNDWNHPHSPINLFGIPNYITLSAQTITRNVLDIVDDTDLVGGTGLNFVGSMLNVSGLTTSEFTSPNISQWTNDAGYVTSISGTTAEIFSAVNDVAVGVNIDSGWTDIDLITEHEKTANMSHSASGSSVTVNFTGTYVINGYYSAVSGVGGNNSSAEGRLMLDTGSGFNEVAGTRMHTSHDGVGSDDSNTGSFSITIPVTAGWVFKLQAQKLTGAGPIILTRSSGLNISTAGAQGAQGPIGPTGAGSNIIIQKDDITIGTVTSTLNFEGSGVASAVDEGSGKTTVTISGGGGTAASVSTINTGTNNAEFASPLGLQGSKYLDQSGGKLSATASGTNTYAATIAPAITGYTNTQRFFIKFTNANTGASTINLNTLGAKAIVNNVNQPISKGTIKAGQILLLAYDGTNFQMIGFKNWQPAEMLLSSVLTVGATFFLSPSVNDAGVYLSMNGGASDDYFVFNFPLKNDGIAYDGSNLRIRLYCAKSAAGTGTVGLVVDYKFLTATTNISSASTNIAQQDTVVNGWSVNGGNQIVLGTMNGLANAQILQVRVLRNSTGTGADSYGGNLRITQIEIEKA